MPEKYFGPDDELQDPTLPAIYDVTATMGGVATGGTVAEAYGAPSPAENRGFVTDPELVGLLSVAGEALGPDVLDRLLQANDRFNQPVTIVDEYGGETRDDYFSHRRFLTELPQCAEAAQQAGLSPAQLEDVLRHALAAVNYPDIQGSQDLTVLLTKALRASSAQGEELTPEDVVKLRGLITKAGRDDAIEISLNSYAAGRDAGLNLADGIALVEGHLDTANYRQIGYNMWTFAQALQALNVASVDPELIKEVFGALEHEHPEWRKDMYIDLKDTIEILCPVRGLTPSELMQAIATNLRAGLNFTDALARVVERGAPLPSADEQVTVIIPSEERDKYFAAQTGELKHAVLPYQTQRPLNDGLRDIERLTGARSRRGETVAEGSWVFDPAANRWYSLGGTTTYIPTGARHSSVGYDLSQLSDTPYVFHIHPEEYASGADKYGYVFPSAADYRSSATVMERAQQPIHPRSFISHPLGVTEFTFPADSARVREVAEMFQDMRDRIFARFGDSDDVKYAARQMGEERFAQYVAQEINARLPEGFAITLHPHGVDLEAITRSGRT
jgi:hypothetical protein